MFSSNTSQVEGGYQISRSLRFNSADSAYLNRTPASAGNRKTWTLSTWFKRSELPTSGYFSLFGADSGTGSSFYIAFDNSTQQFEMGQGATVNRKTTQVFRDPSAWYHLVVAMDTTQATASDRLKIYINGSQITAFATSNDPSLNSDFAVNNNVAHSIGADIPSSGARNYFNGYMTEVYLIDGQALTPSSFGQTNAQTGVWEPVAYTGTYGTNGFYLNFSDNSNTTAATLGKDYSGNSNNWTPNNFSVSAGAGNDSLVDTPTPYGVDTGAGGEVRGNYCTLNPLDKGGGASASNGNLNLVDSSAGSIRSTIGMTTGKWYFESTMLDTTGTVGLSKGGTSLAAYTGSVANEWSYGQTGQKLTGGSGSSYGATFTTNDVIGVAFDADAGTLTFYKNNTSQGVAFTGLTSGPYFFTCGDNQASAGQATNFGQRPFAYTAPSGYKALCTQNLPTPTIGATSTTQAGKYFNPVLWTGTGSTQNITGVGFEADFIWMKDRSVSGRNHYLFDRLRGITNARLFSNLTDAENTSTTYINSTNSDGYQLAAGDAGSNGSGETYVGWNWKANGAGVTNTAGSITSTVSANTTAGFSIVTYTGTGANATVGHGLGVAPSMIIQKNRTGFNWRVYHVSIGNGNELYLDLTTAATSASTWNNTTPTSTVFSIGSGSAINGGSNACVAYCFAPVAGFSAFGSYTGNGSTDGPFIFTGFRPRYLLIKDTTGATNYWVVLDTSRSPYNAAALGLYPNTSDADDAFTYADILSNGFKIRNSSGNTNTSSSIYIYAAFAESPFKYALAR